MNNINIYDIESAANVIDKINDINSQIEEELDKNIEEVDKKKIFQLRYQQFIQGLKLQYIK
jgi:ribosomal protein L29